MLLQPLLLSVEVGLRRGLGLFALASIDLGLPVVVVPGIGDTTGSAHLEILCGWKSVGEKTMRKKGWFEMRGGLMFILSSLSCLLLLSPSPSRKEAAVAEQFQCPVLMSFVFIAIC